MTKKQASLSETLISIDPESIKLDGRGRFEISEILDPDLLDGISGGWLNWGTCHGSATGMNFGSCGGSANGMNVGNCG